MAYKLRQTFPPPAPDAPAGVAPWSPMQQLRVSTPAAGAAAGLEEEMSAQLSEALSQAGFVLGKVSTHFVFAEVLESMWSKFGFSFTGNFTEGWGYNLYAMNGRPGFDSGVNCRYIYQDHVVHLQDCPCPNRGRLSCRISEETGTLQLSSVPETIAVMKRMGLVVNMDGEVLEADRTHSVKHKLTLSRSSANPEVHFTEQLACCPHFTRMAAKSSRHLLGDWQAAGAQVTLRPRMYCQQHSESGRTNSPPTADVDFSGLERALFSRLSDADGQLYLLLKYLLLKALPQALPDKIRPFTELHCRQLMWYLLSGGESRNATGRGDLLLARGRRGLQLMAELLTRQQQQQKQQQKGSSQRNTAFRNFFDQRLGVPFADAAIGLVDRSVLCRVLGSPKRLLTDQVVAYISRLRGSKDFSSTGVAGGAIGGSYFVFRPLLMTIPGCSATLGAPTASLLPGIADYPTVGFRLYQALDILLDERRPGQAAAAEFFALVSSLRPCATTAAACLHSMMALKMQQGPGLAHQALMEAGGGQISVTDCFEASNLTPRMVESALLRTDCAWLYRCKLTKDEHSDHETECHGAGGTAFLAAYPRLRRLFFPATQKPILHSQKCCFVYRLRINFVALWHSLNSLLAKEWGSYVKPSYGASAGSAGGGLESKGQMATRMLLDQPDSVIDPQEIMAQVLICTSSPSRKLLLSAFKSLLVSAAPFHLERGRDEWRWLNLIRLHLMGTWLVELKTLPDIAWTTNQRELCCELVDWCNRYDEHFHCSAVGCGVSPMLHDVGSAAQAGARSVLQSMLETEIEQAFPLTKDSDNEHDLLVIELYAKYSSDKKARAHYERRAKQLASH